GLSRESETAEETEEVARVELAGREFNGAADEVPGECDAGPNKVAREDRRRVGQSGAQPEAPGDDRKGDRGAPGPAADCATEVSRVDAQWDCVRLAACRACRLRSVAQGGEDRCFADQAAEGQPQGGTA